MRKTKQDPERKSTADAGTGSGQYLYVQWITYKLVFKEVKHCLPFNDGGRSDSRFLQLC